MQCFQSVHGVWVAWLSHGCWTEFRGSTFLVDSSNCLMKEFIRLAGVFYEGSLMAILKSVVVPKNSGTALYDTMIRPKDEAHIDFRAEMDLFVAASACPESGRGQAIRVEIYDE